MGISVELPERAILAIDMLRDDGTNAIRCIRLHRECGEQLFMHRVDRGPALQVVLSFEVLVLQTEYSVCTRVSSADQDSCSHFLKF